MDGKRNQVNLEELQELDDFFAQFEAPRDTMDLRSSVLPAQFNDQQAIQPSYQPLPLAQNFIQQSIDPSRSSLFSKFGKDSSDSYRYPYMSNSCMGTPINAKDSTYSNQFQMNSAPADSSSGSCSRQRLTLPLGQTTWVKNHHMPEILNTQATAAVPTFNSRSTTNQVAHAQVTTKSLVRCNNPPFSGAIPCSIIPPTGAGKTGVMELAIAAMLNRPDSCSIKVVYLAPIKALCAERAQDWDKKFGDIGFQCQMFTSDTDYGAMKAMESKTLIISTPEKWDAYTRKWKKHKSFISSIKLMLIDEVHIIKEKRGATLEAIVSRLKSLNQDIRFIAVSATVKNVEDISQWISKDKTNTETEVCVFDESYRPVPLSKVVYGFPMSEKPFMFERNLDYKQADGDNKKAQQRKTNTCEFSRYGVGFHHAGLDFGDRKKIESLFLENCISILCTTSTLAVGVNLPAHLVVIKGTMGYDGGKFCEYSQMEILQMMGRAGRPQFDKDGVAVIMTSENNRNKYETMMSGCEVLESTQSTFLAIRIHKNPLYYKLPGEDADVVHIDPKERLDNRVIDDLEGAGLIQQNKTYKSLIPLELGKSMARYYLRFTTMKIVKGLPENPTFQQILEAMCKAEEFSEWRVAMGEKGLLNELNKHIAIKYPLKGKVKDVADKMYILFQCNMGGIDIKDSPAAPGINRSMGQIFQHGLRVTKCIIEHYSNKGDVQGICQAIMLHRFISAETWDTSFKVLCQVDKIGPKYSKTFYDNGVRNIGQLSQMDPRKIEHVSWDL
ncbi:ATP-dependent DNA helicase MER3 [Mycoemilia scoparia]|uniref:ATP-dependent DNA helicase MER3 n=1 Tax=Mycoemilia scoparia TaxID=417184 RepID=A0A9W8A1L8_9FUNG|nr:ATP-dependent DNA helicase MER3 [Mycoemilia scoparia]